MKPMDGTGHGTAREITGSGRNIVVLRDHPGGYGPYITDGKNLLQAKPQPKGLEGYNPL